MSAVHFIVDAAGSDPDRAEPLFTAGSEYGRALALLPSDLPDEVRLHLYAYELLERVRSTRARTLSLPLWPEALFRSAGIQHHAAAELAAMFETPATWSYVERRPAEIAAACARWLGTNGVDAVRYASCAPKLVEEQGRGRPLPERRTSGAFVFRGEGLLLERRARLASVYPDCWDLPGGHVEPGELPEDALARELEEELGLELLTAEPVSRLLDRDAASGRLYEHHVFVASAWRGAIRPRERQRLVWYEEARLESLAELNPLVREARADLARAE